MELNDIIQELKSQQNEENIQGMARFGINPSKVFGVRIPTLRKIAKTVKKKNKLNFEHNHELAIKLWNYGYHETRILATMIDEPELVTEDQLEKWTSDFNTWDITDQACLNLFDKVPLARKKIFTWCKSDKEFVKRTAFSLIAVLTVHDKTASDQYFEDFFPIIIEAAIDERNFVKKAVNWSLIFIGKRNKNLNNKAIAVSNEILAIDSKSAKWIARNALKELKSEKVQLKLEV